MKTSLFGIYHTLADSGLFDPHYYRAANPEIAASGLDPLVHYIEQGARLGLSPHPAFDVAYYLEQCAARGERPENPLLHYITVGAASGLRHGRPAQAAEAGNGASEPQRRLFIDAPQLRDGAVATPIRGSLTITGWALARAGIAAIDVAVDGMRLLSARHGTPRPDVQAAYPEWEGSLRSGFAATIPHRSLPLGTHAVAVVLRDKAGGQERAEFRIEVEGRADAPAIGALRRKMAQAEIALDCHSLALLGWHPTFLVVVLAAGGAAAIGRLRQTLRTLRVQAYADWRAVLVPRGGGRLARDRVLAGFEDIAARVSVAPPSPGTPLGRLARGGARRRPAFAVMLRAGDELGCDALMEFALATGLDRAADLLYGDDWRADAHGRRAPFLKPGWSPDLLLSTDYVGAWCASAALLDRVALTPARLAKDGGYDAALRLGEAARAIRRVPAVLSQPGAAAEPRAVARRALEAALARRGIAGDVVPGRLAGTWRVRRTLAAPGTVSIIIPTRASRGLVKTCIETLRARTAYRDYEIVVLDHIPRSAEDAATWKSWLKGAADRVVPVAGPFNWSIFNNRAAAQSRGRHLLFLNDDIEIIEPDWLGALLEHGQRAEVGAAGPMLLYPDRTIQHAGMFLAAPGTARHAFRHLPEDDPGYFGLAQMQRDVLAVTGACLLTRRETFEQVGGFDERHTVINGDLDYCLRLWERGLFTVYTPYARLIHHEVASRGGLPEAYDARSFARRWQGLALDGDPFFHPRLSRAADDMVPEAEPVERVTATRPVLARAEVRRILVLKLDHIGDCVTAFPALQRLKRHFPAARLAVLAGPWARDVWRLEPAVDEVIEFAFYHARSSRGMRRVPGRALDALRARLAPCRFDLAIDLRKVPDTRHVLQHTGARCLAGFDHGGRFPWLDVALEWDADPPLVGKRQAVSGDLVNLVDAVAAACEPYVAPVAPVARAAGGATRLPARLFARPVVCVHPAAGNVMRQWPAAHFAALIDLLAERAQVHVALIGGEEDRGVAAAVLAATRQRERVFSLVGKLALRDLPALLRRSVLFVGNNSGPKHLANALGVPTVAVHSGVVDTVEWGPAGPSAVAVRRAMSCAPCYLEKAADCPRGLECLTGLMPIEVYRACERLGVLNARL